MLQFRVSPTSLGFLLSRASGSGTGAAASANLNAVRETMDGESALCSFYLGGGVVEGSAVPVSTLAVSCEGTGKGSVATSKLVAPERRRGVLTAHPLPGRPAWVHSTPLVPGACL